MKIATSILCNFALMAVFLFQLPAAFSQEAGITDFAPDRLAQKCPYTGKSDCKDMCDWLDLTDAQLDKMNDIKTKYLGDKYALKGKKKVLRRQICDLMTKPELDRDQIVKLHKQLNDVRSELCTMKLNYFMDSVEVLDADQKKKVRRKMQKHMLFSRCGSKRGWHKCRKKCPKKSAVTKDGASDSQLISGVL